jgi:hypothetical protein
MALASPGISSERRPMLRVADSLVESPSSTARMLLASLAADRVDLASGTLVRLSAGISRYQLSPLVLTVRGSIRELTFRWGWRFFIVVDDSVMPSAIDVRPGRDAGVWTAGLSSGPRLTEQLAGIARLQARADLDGELHILDAPGLDWSGLWIAGASDALFTLPTMRPINPVKLLRRLRTKSRLHSLKRLSQGETEHATG